MRGVFCILLPKCVYIYTNKYVMYLHTVLPPDACSPNGHEVVVLLVRISLSGSIFPRVPSYQDLWSRPHTVQAGLPCSCPKDSNSLAYNFVTSPPMGLH